MLPSAAGQDVQGPSWEMGWVTDVDPKYLVDLEEDWDLTGELVIYVSNDGPAELNLDITYDYDEDGPFEFDGPESVSVSGNTNDTFTVSITGGSAEEVRSFSPNSKIELTVVGSEQVGSSSLRSQEIQADVSVPRMYRLIPTLVEPSDTLFAGSWVEFTLDVSNLGNTQDAITEGEATIRSCPHLSVTGLEQLENTVVQVTDSAGSNKASFTLRLEASSSHQERTCEVALAVTSEGDDSQRSSTINIDVKAPTVDDDTPVFDDEEEGSSDVTDSNLMWLSFVEVLLVMVGSVVVLQRSSRFS
jgi:hypothetical protein